MAAKTYLISALTIVVLFLLTAVSATAHAKIIYVDDDGPGANDGSSWSDAYNYLRDALNAAVAADEIQIAQGTYKPDQGAGITPGNREATFQLIDGVTIKGGYAGFGEPDPDAWDISLYETILSGDLNDDDGALFVNNSENIYHVVTGSGTDETAVLDGFTVTGGNADDYYSPSGDKGAGMYNSSGNPTVANCTFRANSAGRMGGGMYNGSASPKVTNCTFTGNSACSGGGISNTSSSPVLTDCTFTGNWGYQGGGVYNTHASPKLNNCTFIFNSASSCGGAMYNTSNSYPTLVNCAFMSNQAQSYYHGGGALYNTRSSMALVNSTFTGNWAMHGGGIFTRAGNLRLSNCTISGNSAELGGGIYNTDKLALTNCILWGNRDSTGMGETAQVCGDRALVKYCCIQGLSANLGGNGNIGDDPLFIDADGIDNLFGTSDDNLRLLAGSTCLDAGDNWADPSLVLTDLDGRPRIVDGIVDMGAYEGANQGFLLNTESVNIPEGGKDTFTVALAMDPLGTIQVSVTVESGDPDIIVELGKTLIFDSSNYSQSQTVTLAAQGDEDNINGAAVICISVPGFFAKGFTSNEVDNEPIPKILFVDAGAPGVNNGSNWAGAYTDLKDALAVAAMYPCIVEEVRVAKGIYTPDSNSAEPNGSDNRTATFQLINGVTLKGGYAGSGATEPNARDIYTYKTVLSGDLAGNDRGINDPCDLLNDPCRAENTYHVVTGSKTDMTAVLDGFFITGGNANKRFIQPHGGGLYNCCGSPTVVNCTFAGNSAESWGGGMYWASGAPVDNCTFTKNSASYGGGIYCGYMWGCDANPRLSNCVFAGNSAGTGGGLQAGDSNPTLINCTFSGNSAATGGSMYVSDSYPTLTNCILWGNTPQEICASNCSWLILNYCCVQGGEENIYVEYDGTVNWDDGNIEADPCFVESGFWDANGVWVDGDYHLLPGSPCIDAGDPDYVTGPNETDLGGKPRVIGGRIDMGSYESPIFAEARILPQTINLSSKGNWITCYFWLPEQYNVADIETNSIFLEDEIKPDEFSVDEQQQVATVRFTREDVQPILEVGDINLTITGRLTNGTVFEAVDTIKVLNKTGRKSPN